MIDEPKSRFFLLQVHDCPMELDVEDDKNFFKECMGKCFGDDHKVVNCESVKTSGSKNLFCEMIVKTTQSPNKVSLPLGVKIVMEFDSGLL